MGSLRLAGLALLALGSSSLLFSCGGGDGNGSPTPPEDGGQTVLVQVTTTGDDVDPDGYTVRLGTRTATVQPTGTATFTDVPAGSYQVSLEGVAANCTIQGAATASVTVAGSSGAQTSFTILCVVDFGDGLQTVACNWLSLASTSGIPGDLIAAGTIPASFGPPLGARVLTADGASLGYTWFQVDDEGRAGLVTPVHPSGELEGGDVLIRATDGNVACEAFEFTIDPLPASPGEMGAVVDQLQNVLRAQAAVLETTPEALMATPLEEVPDVLLPMAVVQWVLDHPDNEGSLRRIAEGTAAADVPLELVEAVLATTGLREALGDHLAAAQAAPSGPMATIDAAGCTPAAVGMNTGQLSQCMFAVGETLVEIFEFVGEVQEGMGTAAGILGGLGVEGVSGSGAANAILLILWQAKQQEVYAAARLPCCLTGMTLEANPDRFDEDQDGTGTWSAKITATSKGWDDAIEGIEEILDHLGLGAGLGTVGVVEPDVAEEIGEALPEELDGILPEGGSIPPESFGPVPIDEETWSKATYAPVGEDLSVNKTTHTGYKPVAVGVTKLKVESDPDAFGETDPIDESKEISVEEIEIKVEPGEILLEPDEEVTFKVTVEHSQFPQEIMRGPAAGTMLQGFLSTLQFTGENTADLPYRAPSSPDYDDPDEIEVVSTSTTGARAAENAPRRFGGARIRFGRIEIKPRPFCVDAMEELDFTAEVEGPNDETVEWTATRGMIDQNGHFEAPEDGSVTVTATSNAEPQLVDEVTFGVACTCHYELNVETETIVAEPGDRMTFSSSQGRLTGVSVVRPAESWNALLLPLGPAEFNWPDTTGNWPMRVQGSMGLNSPDILWTSDDDSPAVLNLEEYEPGVKVVGSVAGNSVQIVSTQIPTRPVYFDWSFAIRFEPGQFQCVVPGADGG